MLVVILIIVIAIVAVLAVVVLVAAGRFGEMPAVERTDYVPIDLGPVSATDVVLLRPPTALWGYNQQATDEALEQIAQSIRERDVRIVALEQLVTNLGWEPSAGMQSAGMPSAGMRSAGMPTATMPALHPGLYSEARHGRRPPWESGTGWPPEVSHG